MKKSILLVLCYWGIAYGGYIGGGQRYAVIPSETSFPDDLVFGSSGSSFQQSGYFGGGISPLAFATLPFSSWEDSTVWLTGQSDGTNKLYDFSPARADAAIVGSPCLTFYGVGDYFSAEVAVVNYPIIMSCYFRALDDTSGDILALSDISTYFKNIGIRYQTGGSISLFRRATTDAPVYTASSANTYYDGEFHFVSLYLISDTNGYVTVDGDIVSQTTSNIAISSILTNFNTLAGGALVRSTGSADLWSGSVYDVRLSTGGTIGSPEKSYYWPMVESAGTSVYEVVGNGHNGTLTTGAAWGSTRAGSNWFAERGGSIWTNGSDSVYVPMLSDGSGPASTNVSSYVLSQISMPGAVHNNGPYSLLINGVTNSFADLYTTTNAGWTVTTSPGRIEEMIIEN